MSYPPQHAYPASRTPGGRCPTAPALYGPEPDGDALPSFYGELRREYGPVAPVTLAPGVPAWLVIGHREVLYVAREEQDFSHDPRRWSLPRDGRVLPESPVMPVLGWRPALLYADGQQHRRMRTVVSEAIAGIDGHELRRGVRATAEELIGTFAPRGEADLVAHYAQKLPSQVLVRLLGLDERTGQQLIWAVTGMVAANADSANAGRRMSGILAELVADRRRHPGPDLVSVLLGDPAGLSDDEVLHNLAVMFLAGNHTTVNWISATLRVLLCDPAFRSSLTGGHLTVDDALDLVLWRHPPTQHLPARYATRDLVLAGRPIHAGDLLLLGLAGANRDPEVLPADGSPVVGNRSHLSFGAGPHTCPAQDPARLITRTAVDALHHRLPDLRLSVPEADLPWLRSPWSKGLAALPVRFEPRRRGRESR
ncbi:cytochrome P450 [Streptomyces sp. NPDC058953]|uniref:cytochrome P450 n=1 Tax=unclassified Streptomyces TaxID=2593676 RepID=UPI0036CBFEDE